jgi:hypothetical protein
MCLFWSFLLICLLLSRFHVHFGSSCLVFFKTQLTTVYNQLAKRFNKMTRPYFCIFARKYHFSLIHLQSSSSSIVRYSSLSHNKRVIITFLQLLVVGFRDSFCHKFYSIVLGYRQKLEEYLLLLPLAKG